MIVQRSLAHAATALAPTLSSPAGAHLPRRRWVEIDEVPTPSGTYRTLAYATERGEPPIRTIDLSEAVLNPDAALRGALKLELVAPRCCVVFTCASDEEWVQWISILAPLQKKQAAGVFYEHKVRSQRLLRACSTATFSTETFRLRLLSGCLIHCPATGHALRAR